MAHCTYSVPDLDASGDNLYGPRICWQEFVDWAWDAFDFDKGDWDDGFGWENVCSNTMPLGRTMAAIWALTYSSPHFPRESYDSNILEWGCRFARNHIDEVDGRCGDGNAFAATWEGAFVDDRTELYMPFFYGENVVLRAGTILHESRHADGKGHDSGKNDSSWGYNGAWRWHVCWLAWFAFEAQFTTPALKTAATQKANNILNTRFDTPPGFNV
jgi:hypothetical protein